jgi:hypothetical protein
MKRPPTLIPDRVSHDTVACLETLLEQARRGEVIGVAFGAILKRNNYIVNTAGEAHRNPTFARGILLALDDQLSWRVHGER